MASLDIAVVVILLMVDVMFMLFALGFYQFRFIGATMAAGFGVFTGGYILDNYSSISIGSNTFPMLFFALIWIFLCIMFPSVYLMKISMSSGRRRRRR